MQIDTSGMRGLQRQMQEALAHAEESARHIVREHSGHLARHQTHLAAVDTGQMRAGVHTDFDPDGLGSETGTDVEWGIYNEFGTSRMAAQPFVRPALQLVEPGFRADVAQLANPFGRRL